VKSTKYETTFTATKLVGTDCKLSIGNYNVENLGGNAAGIARMPALADEIKNLLACPDIIGLQEVQDNTGQESTDPTKTDGITDASITLNKFTEVIKAAGCPLYKWTQIDPFNLQEGGAPTGNIRVAFLYNPLRVTLAPAISNEIGSGLSQEAAIGPDGKLTLKYNPGRIDPYNAAWERSRRPLAAAFDFRGERIFIINNHFSSKGGSDPFFGHIQPPTNGGVTGRLAQAKVVRGFVDSLLAFEPNARVIVQGDLNEFQFVDPVKVFTEDGVMVELLEALLPAEERYTYVFDGICQALDHFVVTSCMIPSIAIDVCI
jgi:predicted extracellular nuclease